MNKFTSAGLIASGLVGIVIGFAPTVQAAPTEPGNAQQTINSLESEGYMVIINKLGTTPLDQASVVGIRPGRPVTETYTDTRGHSVERVLYTTIYVDVQ